MPIWSASIGLGLGTIGGIFGGIGQNQAAAAQAKQQNRAAYNKWINDNIQKAHDNGKALFEASWNQTQQIENNNAIFESAHLYKESSLEALKEQETSLQSQLSVSYKQSKGTIEGQLAASNIQGGTAKAIKLSQDLNFLDSAMQVEKNVAKSRENIMTEVQNMLAKQTRNLYQADLQMMDAQPEMQTTAGGTMNILAGAFGGAASGMGGLTTALAAG